jgi:uncharacterized protein YvpB
MRGCQTLLLVLFLLSFCFPSYASSTTPAPPIIHVQPLSQKPELRNGCEVTSLAMLLQHLGHPIAKTELAARLAKDPTPARYDAQGRLIAWGDPNDGFVGDITGRKIGFGVYHAPLARLLDSVLPGRALDLSGSHFDDVLGHMAKTRIPVVVWTTVPLEPTMLWTTWQGPHGPIRATFQEHAVLLVGFDDRYVYINDPFDGTAAKPVERERFLATWHQLGRQAITAN